MHKLVAVDVITPDELESLFLFVDPESVLESFVLLLISFSLCKDVWCLPLLVLQCFLERHLKEKWLPSTESIESNFFQSVIFYNHCNWKSNAYSCTEGILA